MTALGEPDDPADPLLELCARTLRDIRRPAVIGGLAAAKLHGLWIPLRADLRVPETIIVARGRPSRSVTTTQRRDVWGRRRALSTREIEFVDDLPVTAAARTWVDLAATLSLPDLVAVGDSLLRLRPVTGDADLVDAIRRGRGQRGIVRAREAYPMLDARSRSRPESHLRCALLVDGLPKPEVNIAIYDEHGGWLAEPDLVYEAARLTIEYNGEEHAKVRRMRNDISRTLDVDFGGWRQITFGPKQVFEQPHQAAAYVRFLLDERDPGWRRRSAE